jgi:hypothetical protein
MIAELFMATISIATIIHQLFNKSSWLQKKRFDNKLNLIRLEGPIDVISNGTSFHVDVKVENGCKINFTGPYTCSILRIDGIAMCMMHRIEDTDSMFCRRSIEYNNEYKEIEIYQIIELAFRNAKRMNDARIEECINSKQSVYDKKGDRNNEEVC